MRGVARLGSTSRHISQPGGTWNRWIGIPRNYCKTLCMVLLRRLTMGCAPLWSRSEDTPDDCWLTCRSSCAGRSQPPSTDGRTRVESRETFFRCTTLRTSLAADRPVSALAGGAIAACRSSVHDVLQLVRDQQFQILASTELLLKKYAPGTFLTFAPAHQSRT